MMGKPRRSRADVSNVPVQGDGALSGAQVGPLVGLPVGEQRVAVAGHPVGVVLGAEFRLGPQFLRQRSGHQGKGALLQRAGVGGLGTQLQPQDGRQHGNGENRACAAPDPPAVLSDAPVLFVIQLPAMGQLAALPGKAPQPQAAVCPQNRKPKQDGQPGPEAQRGQHKNGAALHPEQGRTKEKQRVQKKLNQIARHLPQRLPVHPRQRQGLQGGVGVQLRGGGVVGAPDLQPAAAVHILPAQRLSQLNRFRVRLRAVRQATPAAVRRQAVACWLGRACLKSGEVKQAVHSLQVQPLFGQVAQPAFGGFQIPDGAGGNAVNGALCHGVVPPSASATHCRRRASSAS